MTPKVKVIHFSNNEDYSAYLKDNFASLNLLKHLRKINQVQINIKITLKFQTFACTGFLDIFAKFHDDIIKTVGGVAISVTFSQN